MAKRKIDFTLRDYWNQDSLLVYKEAVSRYPYCAPARVSFLLNLKALDDPDYERELSFTALAVPDRQRLQEEVRAAEEAAAVARERGERRMRQATARWVAASATTAALGRLMSAHATAPAAEADGTAPAEGGIGGPMDREVDFRAVAANEPVPAVAASTSDAGAASPAAVETTPAAGAIADLADEPARSRSARRNARRLARQWAMEHGASAAATEVAAVAPAEPEPEEDSAVFQTISMQWAATPDPEPAPAPKPASEAAPKPEPARRRPEVFNPWAEVFTAKHTISDWLQAEAEEPASTSAEPAATADTVSPRRVTPKTAKPAKTAAKSKTKTAAKSAKPSAKPKTASKPAPSGYIDPNELIDRFLRQNDDHILIQVDETRDYSTFDPDHSSLREDWSMGSETLAQLYLKQGAPDKAIEIYRYLSLKFPEKNRYFADLIRAAESAKRAQ
ncbi:MAG: hypothetical protein K2O46_01655 [Bacteroidales bacterium]|nr:hypothetical protein [Bacteroidales bacterium]